jgi:hypothetical protein
MCSAASLLPWSKEVHTMPARRSLSLSTFLRSFLAAAHMLRFSFSARRYWRA